MRLFEASHVPEILREAGSAGLHVNYISEKNGVDKTKLGIRDINPALSQRLTDAQHIFCVFWQLIML